MVNCSRLLVQRVKKTLNTVMQFGSGVEAVGKGSTENAGAGNERSMTGQKKQKDQRPTDTIEKQVAQLSQRDRAAGWVSYGQKWKTGTGRQYLRTISIYIQPLRRIWPAKQSKSAKKTPNKGYYAVQGHPRSSKSVPIESPYVTSY